MLKSIQQRDLDKNRWIKITMAVILGLIILSMVVTLIPGLVGGAVSTDSPDTVASVGGQNITILDVQRQLNEITRNQQVPDMLKGFYAQQVLDQLVFERALYVEADRLGVSVTTEEETQRIKQLLPTAWNGDAWLKDQYASEVRSRTGMTVEEFEGALRDEMLTEKFRHMVTDGITVSPAQIEQEFRGRNEKVKIEYALIKPSDLAASIHPSDADLAAYFARNSARYQVPEKRSARYALLDLAKLRANTQVGDDALRAYYNAHIDQYKVENRVHAEHILFKTVGKTDAEIAEIRQKAEDVLKQAKHGGNFEELAKKYSEDDQSKTKGGDLGWIVEGQTVPEFQQAAFSLPKGAVSDLVKTQYGFHIIKVLDHEEAHTKSLEEVRDTVQPALLDDKLNTEANDLAGQMAAAVRQSDRQPLDALAKKFNLELGETPPVSVTEPVGPLGNSSEIHQALFELRPGELSQPLRVEQGYVILTVKDILPGHQGTLAELHDRALADYQKEKSVDLARARAEELVKRTQNGEPFARAAKGLNLEIKTSDWFARNGSVSDVGSGQQVRAAFGLAVGQVGAPTQSGENWLVYRVVDHSAPNPDDLAKQKKDIEKQLLQSKQEAAFAAFKTALEDRLKKEGKLTINAGALKRIAPTT
jgi:peptidyl-prolyl cis-trans isomerase D